MTDIKNSTVIWIKEALFLLLGLFASALLVMHTQNVTIALLLCIAIWAFCRLYYFAFYVIQNYVDSHFRYSGLLSFLHYAVFSNVAANAKMNQNVSPQRRID